MFVSVTMIACSQQVKVDESSLAIKRHAILQDFNSESEIRTADSDLQIDLNYDGAKDYVIRYYGQSGSGIKNKVQVYLFDRKSNEYKLNEQLSELSNPSFFIDKKILTEFYIGNGGGGGSKLEWRSNKWTATKTFEVEENNIKTIWKVSDLLKGTVEYFTMPFQDIPPKKILETNIKN